MVSKTEKHLIRHLILANLASMKSENLWLYLYLFSLLGIPFVFLFRPKHLFPIPAAVQHARSPFSDTLLPSPYDLLITEMMIDPTPSRGLPATEYIEIYNRTANPIRLAGLTLGFDRNNYVIDSPGILLPLSYLILTDLDSIHLFRTYGPALGLRRWPALRNTDGTVSLNYRGQVIHSIRYTDDWYQDNKKKQGGWSLEMIQDSFFCDAAENWAASESLLGGTPGQVNSVQDPAHRIPFRTDSVVIDSTQRIIDLYFNKWMDRFIRYEVLPPGDWTLQQITPRQLRLRGSKALETGIVYELMVQGLDCNNRPLGNQRIIFVKKEKLEAQDLIINEILFNPPAGGTDYVELYNRSPKIFPSLEFFLTNTRTSQKMKIAHLIYPGDYWVMSADPDWIRSNYKKVRADGLVTQNLPSMPDESGFIILKDLQLATIDSVYYHEDYHHPILNKKEGVALERIDPNQLPFSSNWHSAVTDDHYGTPTRKNSNQTELITKTRPNFQLAQKTFSPDEDGLDDALIVQYQMPSNGYLVKIRIVNDQGQPIRVLANPTLLGRDGFIEWDGRSEQGVFVPNGIYILLIDCFRLDGFRQMTKLTAVVLRNN
jgi:hypothetical protein